MFYMRGKYKETLKVCQEYIKNRGSNPYDYRIINIYTETETDIKHLDKTIEDVYTNTKLDKRKMILWMYILLDKALISEQYSIGLKWGKRFKKHAKRSKLFYQGVYLIACIKYSEKVSNLLAINHILTRNLPKTNKEKFTLLKIGQLSNDDQIIWEANSFLKKYYFKSEFSDFIFFKMIQSYKNKNREAKVQKLKKIFLRDFPDSIFSNRIARL
ncbi:MAG: hypothetical protein H7A23_11880 [Leptospiraceae bacterium]|nr:hypothetical protein [Leptospiraceae bacterium]MCP5495246.1 hypothetical protein [Leptospiraceae bacterium]